MQFALTLQGKNRPARGVLRLVVQPYPLVLPKRQVLYQSLLVQ